VFSITLFFLNTVGGLKSTKLIIKEVKMKNIKIMLIIAVIGFNASALATGSKKEPPLAQKSLIEIIIDVFTSE